MSATTTKKPRGKAATKKAEATKDTIPVVSRPIEPLIAVVPEVRKVDIARIIDPPGAPDRLDREGDHERIVALAESLQRYQQQSPIAVEELADGRLVRIYGRRRIKAATLAGWNQIEARVYTPLQEDVRRAVVAIENIDRQDLSPAEETIAVGDLLQCHAVRAAIQYARPLASGCGSWSGVAVRPEAADDLAHNTPGVRSATQHDMLMDAKVKDIAIQLVAGMLSKPPTWVRDRAFVLRLSKKALSLVQEGKLPLAHAREIAKVADEKRRDELAQDFAVGGELSIGDSQPGSIEDLRDTVGRSLLSLAQVPWRTDALGVAGHVPCTTCRFNSANVPGLFEHGGVISTQMRQGLGTAPIEVKNPEKDARAGVCTNRKCYADKLLVAKRAVSAAARRIVEAEPAAKKSGKKGKDAVPAAAKGPTVAAYLSPAAVEAKVGERRAMLKHRKQHDNARGAKPSAAQAEKVRLNNLRIEAHRQWQAAMWKRANDAEGPIAKALAKKPGAWAVMTLVLSSKPYEATHDHNEEKRAQAVASSKFLSLVNTLSDPNWDAVLAIEKEASRQFAIFDAWRDGHSGVVDLIAKALGVDLPEPPSVESFYPKELKAAAKAETSEDEDDGESKA